MNKQKKTVRIYSGEGHADVYEQDFHEAVINKFAMGGEHIIKDEEGRRYSVIVASIVRIKS